MQSPNDGGMLEHAHTRLSEEQYFRFCDLHPEERWELIDGLLWQHPDYTGGALGFAGPTRGHQAIVRNIVRALESRLAPPCRPEESVAVRVPSARVTFRQPDVIVTCDTLVADQRFVDAPVVAVEIFSESTAAVDLLDKPFEFAAIPSIEAYVVIDSRRRRAFAYERTTSFARVEARSSLTIHGYYMSIYEIYSGITF